jgi:hypothetical protein
VKPLCTLFSVEEKIFHAHMSQSCRQRLAVGLEPAKYRNTEASDQGGYLQADLYPVLDRRGIPMSEPIRPVEKQPVQNVATGVVRDFSLDEALPQSAAAIDAQIDRDDASDDFIKEKPHANIRPSRARPYRPSIGRVIALPGLVWPDLVLVQLQE